MTLDIWFPEDLLKMLDGLQETFAQAGAELAPNPTGAQQAYQRGFDDALRAVAVACGLAPRSTRRPTIEGKRLSDLTFLYRCQDDSGYPIASITEQEWRE